MLFSVEDSGAGVAPEQREQVFESFYTSGKIGPDGRKGMGLGLAICRSVVEAHGGRIWVGDSPLGGAQFNFSLPMEVA